MKVALVVIFLMLLGTDLILRSTPIKTLPQPYTYMRSGLPSPMILNIRGDSWTVWDARDYGDEELMTLRMRGVMATTNCDKKQILYDGTFSGLRNTLWHEVFHAGACTKGGASYWNSKSDQDGEHPGVQNLADFVEQFTRTNSEFMKWATVDTRQ